MPQDTLTITDNRTGQSYTVPVENGAIRAMDLRKIKDGPDDFGLMTYDPAFMNTASCRSAITYIDGDKGILRYRGYPIDVLAEKSTYLEVAYLLLFGELPTASELKNWVFEITHHTMLHETTKKFMEGFRDTSHPMTMLVSTVAALSSVYPDSKNIQDPENRLLQIKRLLGKVPSIAAMSYRHISGLPYIYPDNDLTYTENFMNMLWKMVEPKYVANPVLARAMPLAIAGKLFLTLSFALIAGGTLGLNRIATGRWRLWPPHLGRRAPKSGTSMKPTSRAVRARCATAQASTQR